MATTVTTILNEARKYIRVVGGSNEHKNMVRVYNSIKPLPEQYEVKEKDDWCDVFITFLAIQTGATDIIGRECGVQRHIYLFQSLGIWRPGSSVIPQPGYLITFDWEKDGIADHIGIVESVSNGQVHTIEGNADNEVKRRSYAIGSASIVGYAAPNYSDAGSSYSNSSGSTSTAQSGTFYPSQKVNIRNTPSLSGSIVGEYNKGESFVYDSVIESEGYEWLSYISYSGARRYVAWRVKNGATYGSINQPNATPTPPSTNPTTNPTDASTPSRGTFYPNQSVNIRNTPSLSGTVVGQYTRGESFVYDSYVEKEGYIWLSYLSHSGARRYVAWRVKNGATYGSINQPSSTGGTSTPPSPTNPTPQTTPSSGKFFASSTISIRDKASLSGKVVGTYRPGESFVYDRVIKAENHEWLSYISHSGVRRYVAWRVINGVRYGSIS